MGIPKTDLSRQAGFTKAQIQRINRYKQYLIALENEDKSGR
jgi:hypothetical protein